MFCNSKLLTFLSNMACFQSEDSELSTLITYPGLKSEVREWVAHKGFIKSLFGKYRSVLVLVEKCSIIIVFLNSQIFQK
jgi:hypothetical protein